MAKTLYHRTKLISGYLQGESLVFTVEAKPGVSPVVRNTRVAEGRLTILVPAPAV